MSDLISREQAIDAICKACANSDDYVECLERRPESTFCDEIVALRKLPSVEPAQKTGKWKITEVREYDLAYGGRIYVPEYRCSCCGHWYESYVRGDEPKMPDDADFPKYCEQCGARMEREEE